MAISAATLVWLRRKPASVAAGFRYLLVHVVGGLILLAGIVLYISHPETTSMAFSKMQPFAAGTRDPGLARPGDRPGGSTGREALVVAGTTHWDSGGLRGTPGRASLLGERAQGRGEMSLYHRDLVLGSLLSALPD